MLQGVVDRVRQHVYIDDLLLFGTDRKAVVVDTFRPKAIGACHFATTPTCLQSRPTHIAALTTSPTSRIGYGRVLCRPMSVLMATTRTVERASAGRAGRHTLLQRWSIRRAVAPTRAHWSYVRSSRPYVVFCTHALQVRILCYSVVGVVTKGRS